MDFEDDVVDWLIKEEYIIESGINILGEPVYRFTEKFYSEQKELIKEIKKTESDLINSLWFKNFVDIQMNEKGEPFLYLTEKSDDWYSSDELTEEEKSMMYIIYATGGINDEYGRR